MSGIFQRIGLAVRLGLRKIGYAVFLIVAIGLLLLALEKLSEVALKTTYLGDVYPRGFDRAKRDFTEPVSNYDYDLVPGVCLIHNPA